MWFLKILKKFIKAEGVVKALILAALSLVILLGVDALSYFELIDSQKMWLKITLDVTKIVLCISALCIFVVGAIQTWKCRDEWRWNNDVVITSLITGTAGVFGFLSLLSLTLDVSAFFEAFTLPTVAIYYALIPGAFFLALSIFIFVWKIVKKLSVRLWRSLKDAWDRA